MANEDFKDLPRKTASDKVFQKAFHFAKIKFYNFRRRLTSVVYKFVIKICKHMRLLY